MPITGYVVNAPFSLSQVASLLNSSAPAMDVGHICTDSHINPKSRWKPIRSENTLDFVSDVSLHDVDWGYWIPNETNGNSVVNYVNTGNLPSSAPSLSVALNYVIDVSPGPARVYDEPFKYKKPIGDASSPFRMGDFRTYNHNAQGPLLKFQVRTPHGTHSVYDPDASVYEVKKSDDLTVIQQKNSTDNFTLRDFKTFDECYFGAIAINKSNNNYKVGTSSLLIKNTTGVNILFELGLSKTLNVGSMCPGTSGTVYKIVPVVSKSEHSSSALSTISSNELYIVCGYGCDIKIIGSPVITAETIAYDSRTYEDISTSSTQPKFRITAKYKITNIGDLEGQVGINSHYGTDGSYSAGATISPSSPITIGAGETKTVSISGETTSDNINFMFAVTFSGTQIYIDYRKYKSPNWNEVS